MCVYAAYRCVPKCQSNGNMDYHCFHMECDIQGQQYFIYNGMQRVWVTVKLDGWFIALNSLHQSIQDEGVTLRLV